MPRATRTTIDPNSAISVRSGSPTTQPITPPASVTPLTENPSGPLATWMTPSAVRATSDQPITSRYGLDERELRMNDTPIASRISGRT